MSSQQQDLIVFHERKTALDVTTRIDVLAAIKRTIQETGVAALNIGRPLTFYFGLQCDEKNKRIARRILIGHPPLNTGQQRLLG